MKHLHPVPHPRRSRWQAAVAAALLAFSLTSTHAALKDGLVSYWPLDEVVGAKTPDLASGYDMELQNLSAADLVPGKFGQAFKFENARKTMLRRIHTAGEQLPINQHPAFTIAFWARVPTGLSDLRLFSEGNTGNNNPFFSVGTDSTGGSGKLDFFLRQDPWPTVDHVRTEGEPFNDQWHHIAIVQQADSTRAVYLDGVRDPIELPPKPEGAWNVNTTGIGGVQRAAQTFWLTGQLDEVALWNRNLSEAEIQQVARESLVSVFPPAAKGLVSYWPLDEVVGAKTPDLASGYDMELQNLSAADLVPGKFGQAFKFENARKTMLRRIHTAGEQLPINQHPAFTIAFWARVPTGLSDLRLFSEGNTGNNNPFFSVGTDSTGGSGKLDFFLRQDPWPTVDHVRTEGEPFNDQWHHIAIVQQADSTRAVYLDGVRDPIELPPKPEGAWNVNTTGIGGVQRAAQTFWLTGQLDEVALWNRNLSETEIAGVVAQGVPVPYTKPQPLAIRSFTADLPAVAAGDKITLRWDVTKNVQVEIDQGVGDVTSKTVAGLGSTEVVIPASRKFTMTLRRGLETVFASVSVAAIAGVAPGWSLVDNFDRYSAGLLSGKGGWADLSATGMEIIENGGNRLLAPVAGDVAGVLLLRTLTVNEGQERTLFFRVLLAGEPAEVIRTMVALTDRNLRFGNENNIGLGPHFGTDNGVGLQVGAVNGYQGTLEYTAEPVLAPLKAYNVWVDVKNAAFPDDKSTTGDTFTVHIQEDGTEVRTTVLTDIVADRDPVGDAVSGPTEKQLDKLVVNGRGGSGTEKLLLFDDFYLSKSGFNATVPRPFGFTTPMPDQAPTLTIKRTAGGQIEITWTGGTLEAADLVTGAWTPVPGAGAGTYTTSASGSQRYYRARQ